MIHRLHIPKYSKEWYDFRMTGYGASEIATVLSEYNQSLLDELPGGSPIQTHLHKIGENTTVFQGNAKSKAGQSMESVILNFYRHWDHNNPTAEVMYDNLAAGEKCNKVKSCSFIFTNDEYPWLYYSPDGVELVKNSKGKWKEEGLLEIKNTTSYQAKKYTYGVSPTFIAQVAQGLLISKLKYARILVFIDGWELQVITLFNNSDGIIAPQKSIVNHSYLSWRRVLECRKIKLEYGIDYYYQYNVDEMTEMQQKGATLLQELEPDFIGSEHEFNWVNDNIIQTPEFSTMDLTDNQWSLLVNRKGVKDKLTDEENELKKNLRKIESELKISLGGFHQADYEGEKAFSFKPDRNGTKRFYVNDKIFDIKEMAGESV